MLESVEEVIAILKHNQGNNQAVLIDDIIVTLERIVEKEKNKDSFR